MLNYVQFWSSKGPQELKVRVSGGTIRGRRFRAAKGMALRPTSVKVKEALFDILGSGINGARFADFFAGTGNIGIEALSRGAACAVFVEHHRPSIKILEKNLAALNLQEKAILFPMDAFAFLRLARERSLMFDIVYADPPYSGITAHRFLKQLGKSDIIGEKCALIVEHFHKQDLPDAAGNLALVKRYRYGDTILSFYQNRPAEERLR